MARYIGKLGTMERQGKLNERSRIKWGCRLWSISWIKRKANGYHFDALLKSGDGTKRPVTLSHVWNVYEVPAPLPEPTADEWWW